MQLGSTWIDGLLGLMSLLAGLYSVVLLAGGRARFAPAAAHAAMGIGMAAMFVPVADPLPRPVWVAVFVVMAVWFCAAGLRDATILGEAGHHAVGAVAMLFMLYSHAAGAHAAGAAGASGAVEHEHAHHGGAAAGAAAPPLLMTAIALVFVAWFLVDISRLVIRPGGGSPMAAVPEPVGAGEGTPGAVGSAVLDGLDRHVAVPGAVMSGAMAIMFLGMI